MCIEINCFLRILNSSTWAIETNLPYSLGFLILNQFLSMFMFKNWKNVLQFLMWNDFPSFLTCIFYIFAFITSGKQLHFEISEMTTHTPCARDILWTLDSASAFLSLGVNNRTELVPSPGLTPGTGVGSGNISFNLR